MFPTFHLCKTFTDNDHVLLLRADVIDLWSVVCYLHATTKHRSKCVTFCIYIPSGLLIINTSLNHFVPVLKKKNTHPNNYFMSYCYFSPIGYLYLDNLYKHMEMKNYKTKDINQCYVYFMWVIQVFTYYLQIIIKIWVEKVLVQVSAGVHV